MKKFKKIIASSLALIIALLSVTVIYAAFSDGIIEKHNITLSDETFGIGVKAGKYSNYVQYSGSLSKLYINSNYELYDLIAVTGNESDVPGFVIDTGIDDQTYTLTVDQKLQFPNPTNVNSYILAIRHYDYNAYVNTEADLELLNLEYRHKVINDDLNIGDATSFYTNRGEYISNLEEYDLANGLYDYRQNVIKSITDGTNTYKLPVGSSTVVNLTKFYANDFYDNNSDLYTSSSYNVSNPTELYNRYDSTIDSIVYSYNGKLYYYVFTNEGVYVNGTLLSSSLAPTTIDLDKAWYANGQLLNEAYSSKVFKNIYLLNNITIDRDITLIMPFHMNLLNKDITLEKDLTIKNYYKSDIKFTNTTINFAGDILGSKKIYYTLPNADITYSDLDFDDFEEKSSTLVDDVLEFIGGFLTTDIQEDDKDYHLFIEYPSLPYSFFSEDIDISYTFKSSGDDFHITHSNDNQKYEITVEVIDNKNNVTKTQDYNVWIRGDSNVSKMQTLAKKLEFEISDNYAHSNVSKILINYDSIENIIDDLSITLTDLDNVNSKIVYKEVMAPINGNQTSNLYTYNGSAYVLFNNKSGVVDYGNATYYEKYLEVERLNYTFEDNSNGVLRITYDNTNYDVKVALNKITVDSYIELIKNEIGTIYFAGEDTTFNLKSADDLAKYNVSSIVYTPVVYANDEYSETPALTVTDDVLTNVSAAVTSNYHLKVNVTLKSGETVEFYTERILFTSSSTGGDGENEYMSSSFEEDFNKISTFIGLSNTFSLNGNRYFYMEITNPDDVVGIYKKIDYKTWSNSYIGYYYADDDLVLHEITAEADIPAGTKAIYKETALTDSVIDNQVVFITDNSKLDDEEHKINVIAYITDRQFDSASALKTSALNASSVNLYQGLYDANNNPIKSITNGENVYTLTYNSSNVVTDVTYDGNHLDTATVNIIGYYYQGYVYNNLETGAKFNPTNGIYTNKTVKGNGVESAVFGKVTVNYTYDEIYSDPLTIEYIVDFSGNEYEYYDSSNNLITSSTYNLNNGLYDVDGNGVEAADIYGGKFTFTYSGGVSVACRSLTATAGFNDVFGRSSSQQTTFFRNGEVLTVYVQNYAFTVPAIYTESDLNASASAYNLYNYMMEAYAPITDESTNHGYKEVNGAKYYLLRSYLEPITNLSINADSYNLDPSKLAQLENLEILTIEDAIFETGTMASFEASSLKTRIKELTFIDVDLNQNKQCDLSGFTNLEKLVMNGVSGLNEVTPKLYRKIVYLDVDNCSLRKINEVSECSELEYLDITYNNIAVFDPIKDLRKLKYLYVQNNTFSTRLNVLSGIYPYGTPQGQPVISQSSRGFINLPNLVAVYESNDLIDCDFETYISGLNQTALDYVHLINSIAYLSTYNNEMYLDLSLLVGNGYDIEVYTSTQDVYSTTELSLVQISPIASQRYEDGSGNKIQGLFKTNNATSALIVITNGMYTVTRQIFFTIESYGI